MISIFEYIVLPILYLLGIINPITLGLLLLSDGPLFRTPYTLVRMIQAAFRRQEIPWIAFLVSLIPLFGMLAYPCQMMYSATEKQSKIARLIIYDAFTRIGEHVPIWGGKDTYTEHFFNRIADRLVR